MRIKIQEFVCTQSCKQRLWEIRNHRRNPTFASIEQKLAMFLCNMRLLYKKVVIRVRSNSSTWTRDAQSNRLDAMRIRILFNASAVRLNDAAHIHLRKERRRERGGG